MKSVGSQNSSHHLLLSTAMIQNHIPKNLHHYNWSSQKAGWGV
jgi:hypothetical protein